MTRATLLNATAALVLLAAALLTTCGAEPEATPAGTARGAPEAEPFAEGREATWLTGAESVALEPAAVVDAAGRTWVAWIDYRDERGAARVSVAVGVRDEATGALTVGFRAGAERGAPATPTLAAFGDGVYLVYEGGVGAARGLYGHMLALGTDGIEAGDEETIIRGHVLFPSIAETFPGLLEIAHQSLVGENYVILHRVRSEDGAWSPPRPILSERGDAWRPRVASGNDGVLHLVYDAFDGERFVVEYMALEAGFVLEERTIAGTEGYQGFPELTIDDTGRVWIAWETARQFGEIGGLRAEREARLACLVNGRLFDVPQEILRDAEGRALRADFPRPVATPTGLLLTSRTPGATWEPRRAGEYAEFYTSWFTRVARFEGRAPAHTELLPDTDGDGEATESLLVHRDGRASAVFSADLRTRRRPKPGAFEEAVETVWRLGALELPEAIGFPPLVERQPNERAPSRHGTQLGPVAAFGGERPFFGDLHRHTQLSRCQGTRDGTALDVYRYARGPGGLDFLSITDHYQHLTPWSHWRALRDVERFHAPGTLVVFAGVERALRERAHVNEVYERTSEVPREIAAFHREPDVKGRVPVERTLAIPHMMGMPSAPFPWSFFREDLMRVVEVYQGLRGSYEGAGLPYEAMNREVDASSIASGLRRGLHFGLIAASDHRASSTAYAGVWASELTREAVFEALRARRTFATTSRATVHAQLGPLAQGGEGEVPAGAEFELTVAGPAPVATVEVIQDGEVVERLEGSGSRELVVVSCRRYQALGTSPPDALELSVEGATLVSARERMRGETGATLTLEDGVARLEKAIPWIDVVLELEHEPDGDPTLVLRLGELVDRVPLDSIEPGRSIKHPDALVRESIWRIGRPLEDTGERPWSLRIGSLDLRAGSSLYARIAFSDGNLVWTSPVRVTGLDER